MCGCGGVRKSVGLSASDAAVMCLVCIGPGGRRVGEHCTADADERTTLVPVTVRAHEGTCPLGRHDVSPRWLGVRWAGVPRPVRWALGNDRLRVRLGLLPFDEMLQGIEFINLRHALRRDALEWREGKRRGCGCVVALKAAWTRASSSAWGKRLAAAAVFAGMAWAACI